MTQMESKTCCKDFNCPINVVFFCRNINIGKIKADKNIDGCGCWDRWAVGDLKVNRVYFITQGKSSIVGGSEMGTREKSLSFAFEV